MRKTCRGLAETNRSQKTDVRGQKTEDKKTGDGAARWAEAGHSGERMNPVIKSVKDLRVYEKAYQLAMNVFEVTKKFPKEETYSLTDQIRRSSRSVAMNIREGYAKRKYEQVFLRHLNDSLGSAEETRGWLEFASDCGFVTSAVQKELDKQYDELNAMLYSLMNHWESFSK